MSKLTRYYKFNEINSEDPSTGNCTREITSHTTGNFANSYANTSKIGKEQALKVDYVELSDDEPDEIQ